MLARFFVFLFALTPLFSSAAVILQYHHVSDNTPPSTSISPAQFKLHMTYLKENGFTVVPLNNIVDAIKKKQPMGDKWVAITFDDAYEDILINGTPILNQFNYPYTIFVNPGAVDQSDHLSWSQLHMLSEQGVMLANHGMNHDSLARIPEGMTPYEWLAKQSQELLESEALIKQHTGQSWRYFAYPYGEFTPEIQQWLVKHDFVGFSQQSGAAGLATDTSILPRFPVSKPYDKLASLRDKLNSLPLNIEFDDKDGQTVFEHGVKKSAKFTVEVDDFLPNQLNCYISGLGRQKIKWLKDDEFEIVFNSDLPVGRVRCNCTAPSRSESGRFYWYSKPWFILKTGGDWYPL